LAALSGFEPGDFSQFAVASICRALRKSRSRSTPAGVPIACLRKRFASSLGSTAIVFKRATQSNPVSAKSIPYDKRKHGFSA
jgi:hypothetical protein